MENFTIDSIIGICGAGAMGAGIAQVAAKAGHHVIVYDSFSDSLSKGKAQIKKGTLALIKRGKISSEDGVAIEDRISWTEDINRLAKCSLVIEAIVESPDIKTSLFKSLEGVISNRCLLASNTSSLSISSLASSLKRPQNFLGLHFFNPAPIMKLVEVIEGLKTNPNFALESFELMKKWGKKPVAAKDVPGFIVNRVARPFYAEGWQAFEEGVADAVTIDFLHRDLAGFRMGPLELGDLIGHDVNSKAARSVYQSYFGRTRFRPSLMQAQLAESGLLGRKSGHGVYDYSNGAVKPEVNFELGSKAKQIISGPETNQLSEISGHGGFSSSIPRGCWSVDDVIVGFSNGSSAHAMSDVVSGRAAVLDIVRNFEHAESLAYSASDDKAALAARALISAFGKKPIRIADRPGALVFRTMLQLVNASADALRDKVASADDIDTALQFGVNYPFGPMAWATELGLKRVVTALGNIAMETGEASMYQPNDTLRRLARG